MSRVFRSLQVACRGAFSPFGRRGSASLAGMLTVVAALALSGAAARGGERSEHLNVVLIMADDMGYECLSVHGSDSYQTPHLDALASQGMRFTHCHSQPLCTPSRVQIMTGRYNSRNYTRFGHLDPAEKTFAHRFRDAGYATAIVGKWQLGGGFDQPDHFGFDEYCLWQLTRRPNRYPNPGLEINGEEVDFRDGQYGPDIASDYACDFMERHREQPFLLYYPMILPHFPFEPTPDSADWDPAARRNDPKEKGGHGDNRYFADMVAYTDKMVGKVVGKLDELGLVDNTLVLFTGDNGTMRGITSVLGGRSYPGGKGQTSDNGTHVPLVVRLPGRIAAGAVCDDLVDFSDVLPTIAEAAGLEPLAGRELAGRGSDGRELDGRSFWPQLTGQPGNPRNWIYCWYYRSGKVGEKWSGNGGEFARTKNYKYYLDGGLYDVSHPYQEHAIDEANLDAEQMRIRDQLRAVVLSYHRKPESP